MHSDASYPAGYPVKAPDAESSVSTGVLWPNVTVPGVLWAMARTLLEAAAKPPARTMTCRRSTSHSSLNTAGDALGIGSAAFARLADPEIAPREIGRRSAGMNKDDHIVRTEAAFAQVRDHARCGLAGVNGIEDDAFLSCKEPNGFGAALGRDPVTLTDEAVEVDDVVLRDGQVV